MSGLLGFFTDLLDLGAPAAEGAAEDAEMADVAADARPAGGVAAMEDDEAPPKSSRKRSRSDDDDSDDPTTSAPPNRKRVKARRSPRITALEKDKQDNPHKYLNTPQFLSEPDHGTYNSTRDYGSSMETVLGPAAADPFQNRGSATTEESLSSVMTNLHRDDPGNNWKAGHLLNAEMGGNGTDDLNLVPLTGQANRLHSTYENRLKKVCDGLQSYHESPEGKADTSWYGVRYKVEALPDRFHPNSSQVVPSGIHVEGKLVRVGKMNGIEEDVRPGDKIESVLGTDRFGWANFADDIMNVV